MELRNDTYNTLKFLALVVLPALGSAYFAVSGIWGIPYSNEVVSTLTIVDTFLGAILHVSTRTYSLGKPAVDGKLIVDKSNPAKDVYQFALMTPLSELDKRTYVMLQVEPGSTVQAKTTVP